MASCLAEGERLYGGCDGEEDREVEPAGVADIVMVADQGSTAAREKFLPWLGGEERAQSVPKKSRAWKPEAECTDADKAVTSRRYLALLS